MTRRGLFALLLGPATAPSDCKHADRERIGKLNGELLVWGSSLEACKACGLVFKR